MLRKPFCMYTNANIAMHGSAPRVCLSGCSVWKCVLSLFCVGLPYNLNRAERHEISALGPFFKVSLSCLPEHYGLAMDSNAIDRKTEQMGKLSIKGGHED